MSTSDDDEFDSVFDDQNFLDPDFEESLAQAEATYTASQAVHQPAPSSAARAAPLTTPSSSFSLRSHPSDPARRTGSLAHPPAKKQRLDPAPSNLSRVVALHVDPEPDQVIVRDLREEEFGDKEDETWWAGNNALDQVEQAAIRMSQQLSTSQPRTSTSKPARTALRSAQDRSWSPLVSTRPPDPALAADHSAENHERVTNDELEKLRAEVEQLRAAHKAHKETVDRLKQETYRKSGEVAVVRQNLTKLNLENSKLREREVVREQEHRTTLERLQKDQERRLQRLETETAFRRVEQDTSRRIWPSSVARLPPLGLRDVVDRRQESQARAGLTTPTKADRYGVRVGSSSSGHRHRYAEMAADRKEPGTPTRSDVRAAPPFPQPPPVANSATKAKAFRGLQNSFADFGPVQEKIRQQRQSPAKISKTDALPPADWDMDASGAMESARSPPAHDDTLMNLDDDFLPAPPIHRNNTEQQDTTLDHQDQQKERKYLVAVSEILSRRNTIVSLLLSHSSVRAASPACYPSNRFNPSSSRPSEPTSHQAEESPFSSSTLRRIISAQLVSDCPQLLLCRYRKAVETLLTSLSRARILEAEEREIAFHVLSADNSDGGIEDLVISSAATHLSIAIASSLMAMAGVLLRLCQTDLLTDVLRLVSCLISTLPRFYSDLECLQTDPNAKSDELAFLGLGEVDAEALWSKYTTPTHVREILAQCIDECQHPDARKSDGSNLSKDQPAVDYEDDQRTQGSAAASKQSYDDLGLGNWTLSSEAREDLFHAVVQVLEAMSQSPEASLTSSHHPLRLLSRPGVFHKLLHPDRSSSIIFSVTRMLSSAVSNAPLIHKCLASKSDSQGHGRASSRSTTAPRVNARFPVLELLVKHLVDRRFDMAESEWHMLHCAILTFLTQAALRSADTLIVLADSAALLAALIRCLSLDSDFVWLESRPTFMLPPCMSKMRRAPFKLPSTAAGKSEAMPGLSGADFLVQAVERIVMDTRLLNLLYNSPLPISADHTHRFDTSSAVMQERTGSISLAAKLDQPETYSMLNGIRQSFIVALSRIAFCSEPDWIASERKLLASLLRDLRKRADQVRRANAEDAPSKRAWTLVDEEMVVEEVQQNIRGLDRISMLLEAIADVAGDLADIVLSPEEIDGVYELLVSEEDEDDEDTMNVDREDSDRRGGDVLMDSVKGATEVEAGSETESEPELVMEQAGMQSKRAMSRTSSRASKSVSPTKHRNGDSDRGERDSFDVIEIDDSD